MWQGRKKTQITLHWVWETHMWIWMYEPIQTFTHIGALNVCQWLYSGLKLLGRWGVCGVWALCQNVKQKRAERVCVSCGAKFQPCTVFNNPSSDILQTCTYLPHSATTHCCTVTITFKAHLTLLCTGSCRKHYWCKQRLLPREYINSEVDKASGGIYFSWILGYLQLECCRKVKAMVKLSNLRLK